MPENKSCHNCVNEKALNPCMGCVKYEKWMSAPGPKPKIPHHVAARSETEKRVFEGIVGDDSYGGIIFGDNKKLSLNIVPETEDEERAWRKLLNMRVRITVEKI